MNLEKLKQVIPFKWRVQSKFVKQGKTMLRMIAYVDARDVQNQLDDVVGAENWQDEYYQQKSTLFCKIGIFINGVWVWKSGAGIESKTQAQKGESSDAFKRAGVKWGINRDAYTLEPVTLNSKEFNNKFYPTDENGKFLKGQKLHNYCNRIAKIEELENFVISDTTNKNDLE